MQTILQINASLFGEHSQSSRLAGSFVKALTSLPHIGAGCTVIVRNLGAEPLPHLTAERFLAFVTPAEQRTPEQASVAAESDALVDELRRADVIVVGLPMYNFGVPSTLKAYFDHVARAGVTFRYTESGPEGLLKGKKAYVFATRGGRYAGTPSDLQTGFVKLFLGFVGIEDVEFVYAEGLSMGPESREAGLATAEARIEQLAA